MNPQMRLVCSWVAFMLVLCAIPGYAQESEGPRISAGVLEDVGDEWQTVSLPQSYTEMVVVAVPAYEVNQFPAVVRIKNVGPMSFDVRVQNPSGENLEGYTVHYMAIEEGVYTVEEHGVLMEATRVTSEEVAHQENWTGDLIDYKNDYSDPVILGQVLSSNDDRWSVFWARGFFASSPPDVLAYVGHHVGEDFDQERENEEIGYIIVESGSGMTGNYAFHAFLGDDSVGGMENGAPFMYSHDITEPDVVLLAAAGMDGVNGGWPVIWGEQGVAGEQLMLSIDEDQIGDSERQHTDEQVAVLVLEQTRVLPALSSFEPKKGEVGSEVIVRGTLLSSIEEAYLGEVLVSGINLVSDQELRLTVPAGASSASIRLLSSEGIELVSLDPFVITLANAQTGSNLCRLTEAKVSQSSEAVSRSGPENACDGILEGSLEEGSIAATRVENESWWEVDLGAVYNISEVVLNNRMDCCQGDLSNFFIFISDVPFLSKSAQTTLAEPNVRTYFVGDVGNEAAIAVGHEGRYVRLQYPGEGGLGLSEVGIIAANGLIVDVNDEREEVNPGLFELGRPYPSPASGLVHFPYTLPGAASVELAIYNSLGQRAMQSMDLEQSAGNHLLSVPTSSLASGMYIVKLSVGDEMLTRLFIVEH